MKWLIFATAVSFVWISIGVEQGWDLFIIAGILASHAMVAGLAVAIKEGISGDTANNRDV